MKKNSTNIRPRVEETLNSVREKYNIYNRKFTEADFYRICKKEKIGLIGPQPNTEKPSKTLARIGIRGYIITVRKTGKKYIWLHCLQTGGKFDLFTAFHELGHYFFGHRNAFSSYNTDGSYTDEGQLKEDEADMFAGLATGKRRLSPKGGAGHAKN